MAWVRNRAQSGKGISRHARQNNDDYRYEALPQIVFLPVSASKVSNKQYGAARAAGKATTMTMNRLAPVHIETDTPVACEAVPSWSGRRWVGSAARMHRRQSLFHLDMESKGHFAHPGNR